MIEKNTKNWLQSITEEYFKSGPARAKEVLDYTITMYPGTNDEFSARFIRARGYEAGWFGSIECDKAKNDYDYLIRNNTSSIILSECLLGCARILYTKKGNVQEIKELCDLSESLNKNHKSLSLKVLTLLGFSYEIINKDYKTASKYYISSFYKGSKRGLAYYSYAKLKNGNYTIGIISLVFYYILYPMLSVFDKSKYPVF